VRRSAGAGVWPDVRASTADKKDNICIYWPLACPSASSFCTLIPRFALLTARGGFGSIHVEPNFNIPIYHILIQIRIHMRILSDANINLMFGSDLH
jgi:hypothetical protein